ncbi:glycosyltransferase family 2 protein [uncultured Amaricoccus sp.]|uniref:glycosyltransferase family 2 protein n=1 Tax=uncultured Amaricoccus sp. TaxID=339341 RepID=UPI002610F151|nr:glycosyltransferase family 2 protein [uncultured Amaricoccus sp.]
MSPRPESSTTGESPTPEQSKPQSIPPENPEAGQVAAPWLSIVVPMKNEAENVAFVTEAIAVACAGVGPFEAIYVDDASTDATAAAILALRARFPFLRLVRHPLSAGQSAAIHSGVLVARGDVICTLDGDGQNPPSEIPKLLGKLEANSFGGRAFPEGVALVAGQRVGRRDTLSKRWASRAANAIRQSLLRDGTRDTGCGLKLFRRDAFLALPYFDHMHRYLPALFARDGWQVTHVDVAHAERHAGRSNYANLGRALVGIYDLIGVAWLIRRRKKARGTEVLEEVS